MGCDADLAGAATDWFEDDVALGELKGRQVMRRYKAVLSRDQSLHCVTDEIAFVRKKIENCIQSNKWLGCQKTVVVASAQKEEGTFHVKKG